MNKKIFISTGEVSGDLHGSLLSKALFNEVRNSFLFSKSLFTSISLSQSIDSAYHFF